MRVGAEGEEVEEAEEGREREGAGEEAVEEGGEGEVEEARAGAGAGPLGSPASLRFRLSPMETERDIFAMELVVGFM